MRGFLTATLLMLTLAGCSSGSSSPADNPLLPADAPQAAELAAALPALPPADAPGASTSSLLPMILTGSFTWAKSANANVAGTTLELLAGPLDYSWALYSFDVGGYDIEKLSIECELTDPENCWYVFADYDNGHWIFVHATATSPADLFIPQRELRSPGGTFYFGLVCYGSTAFIDSVTAVIPRTDWVNHVIVSGTAERYPSRLGGAELIGGNICITYGVIDISGAPLNEIRLVRSSVEEPQTTGQWVSSGVYVPGEYLIDKLVMAQVAGLPSAAWIFYDDQSLWFAQADSAQPAGLADWDHIPLGNIDFIGLLDLAEVDGRPAMVYANQNAELHLVMHYGYADTPDPASPLDWTDTEAIEAVTFEFDDLELRQVNGTAALAFNTRSIPGFIYAYCDSATPSGTGNWVATLLGEYSSHINGNLPSISITEIGGNPAALFQSRVTGLIFAGALVPEPMGFTDWRGHTLTTDVFNAQSLALTGEGWLACCVDTAGKLQTFLSNTDQPAYTRDWRQATAADVGTNVKPIAAVSTVNGTPMVIYIDVADRSLKCARYAGM